MGHSRWATVGKWRRAGLRSFQIIFVIEVEDGSHIGIPQEVIEDQLPLALEAIRSLAADLRNHQTPMEMVSSSNGSPPPLESESEEDSTPFRWNGTPVTKYIKSWNICFMQSQGKFRRDLSLFGKSLRPHLATFALIACALGSGLRFDGRNLKSSMDCSLPLFDTVVDGTRKTSLSFADPTISCWSMTGAFPPKCDFLRMGQRGLDYNGKPCAHCDTSTGTCVNHWWADEIHSRCYSCHLDSKISVVLNVSVGRLPDNGHVYCQALNGLSGCVVHKATYGMDVAGAEIVNDLLIAVLTDVTGTRMRLDGSWVAFDNLSSNFGLAVIAFPLSEWWLAGLRSFDIQVLPLPGHNRGHKLSATEPCSDLAYEIERALCPGRLVTLLMEPELTLP
jgi:hypothetical protein